MVFIIFQVSMIIMSLPVKLITIAFYLTYWKSFQVFVQYFTVATVFIINHFLNKTPRHTLLHLLKHCKCSCRKKFFFWWHKWIESIISSSLVLIKNFKQPNSAHGTVRFLILCALEFFMCFFIISFHTFDMFFYVLEVKSLGLITFNWTTENVNWRFWKICLGKVYLWQIILLNTFNIKLPNWKIYNNDLLWFIHA